MQRDSSRSETAHDPLAYLSQSPNRVTILGVFEGGTVYDRYDFEDEVDTTRRTIRRTLRDLEKRGYVQETADGYRRTALGGRVYDRYEEFVESVTFDDAFLEFISHVPDDLFPFSIDHLADGEVTVATDGGSYAPLDRLLDVRADATRVRELAPGVERRSIEQLADRISAGEDVSVDIVLSPAALESATSNDQYAGLHGTIMESDAVDFYVAPDGFEIAICVADGTAVLSVEDGSGHVEGTCLSTDPVVVEWAEESLDERIEAAEPLQP